MSAAILTITPELREARLDWLCAKRKRLEEGGRWFIAEDAARAAYEITMARLADFHREAVIAKKTLR